MKRKKLDRHLLAATIIIHIFICVVFFAFFRQGYHSDETWSFGLANSIGQPHFVVKSGVYLDYMTGEDHANVNEWITGKDCNDYLTVQKGEQFDLVGIYNNMKLDHHPFLFFWLVNIVCSMFPDRFSYWYVFILQLVFLCTTQIYLYKLGKIVLPEKKWSPLILCFLYATGRGGMVTFTFIRQYSLLTMFVVMHFYYQSKLLTSKDFNIKKYMFPVALTALLGLLTHYYMVCVAFGSTLMICIYLLFKKKIKKMFAYGFSMVGVIVSFLFLWPSAIRNISTGNMSYKSFPLETQMKISFSDTLKSICGLEIDPMRSAAYSYVIAFIVIFSSVAIPLCFLFRNEEWFKTFVLKCKHTTESFLLSIKKESIYIFFYLTVFLIIIIYLIVVSYTVDIFRMGELYTRYMFALFPLMCFVLVGITGLFLKHLPYLKKYCAVILLILSVLGSAFSQVQANSYILKQPGNMTMDEATDFFEGKDVQFLTSHDFVVLYSTNIFRKAKDVRFVLYDWFKSHSMEEFDPHKEDFYYIVTDMLNNYGDPDLLSETSNVVDDDKTKTSDEDITDKKVIFNFADDVTDEQKEKILMSMVKSQIIPEEEQKGIMDYFRESGYNVEWLDDMQFNGIVLKIFHVTRTTDNGND